VAAGSSWLHCHSLFNHRVAELRSKDLVKVVRSSMKKHLRLFYREWIRPLAIMFIIIAPLRSAVVDWNWVPSGSMKPTIMEGDLVLIDKLAYDLKVPFTTMHLAQWDNPKRGDVVVFFAPDSGTRLVKRVVGLPGDVVELRNEVLFLNGKPLNYRVDDPSPFKADLFEDATPLLAREQLGDKDHYVMILPNRTALRTFGATVIPEGKYFVMGDSRDNSHDSRFFGTVPRDQIVGRVPAILFSFSPARYLLPRISRFFRAIDAAKS
jgi:signal peptidase I